jgi:hypothetical protein
MNPSGGMGGEVSTSPSYELIDDMEDQDPNLLVSGGRNGRWNTYNDGSAGSQAPATDFTDMQALSGDAPHADSSYSAYTSGSGFTGFGAVLNATMRSWPNYDETPPYDASEFTGLSFFAKVGAGASRTVRVRLVTTDTDPRGGICAESGEAAVLCFDHFVTQLTLSEEWARYDVSFDDFGQTGAGMQFSGVAVDSLYTVEFLIPGSGDFELWVDDLSFILPPQ